MEPSRWSRAVTIAAVLMLAGIAAVVSYLHMYELALRQGELGCFEASRPRRARTQAAGYDLPGKPRAGRPAPPSEIEWPGPCASALSTGQKRVPETLSGSAAAPKTPLRPCASGSCRRAMPLVEPPVALPASVWRA